MQIFQKSFLYRKKYEEVLNNSLNSFYKDEQFVITGIELVAKLTSMLIGLPWLLNTTKESILRLIEEEKKNPNQSWYRRYSN